MRSLSRLHRAILSIARLHASPGRLFAACVVGAIVGSTPLFGLHFFVCLGLATVFRLNVVAMYAAANISIPPLAPFLGAACVAVGGKLVFGSALPFDRAALHASSPFAVAPRLFVAWLVGAPFVGGAIGVAIGASVASIARRRAAVGRDATTLALEETVARYREAPPGLRHYVTWKTRLDPVYRAIAGELPDAITVVDLGTGLATLPILLALLGTRRTLIGFEWDAKKADAGRVAAGGLRVTVTQGDVRDCAIPPCDAITLVDVLHYFPVEEQRAVLARARAALRPGGCLLVRETDAEARSGTTRWLERLAVKLGWNRADATHFRPAKELARDLEALGLSVEQRPVAGKLHPGNVLLRATAC
ncbi:MAG: DUF2062 domain-containing protein [Myxococcales bacterium]|nr:DUF2062 domain-containing protein [Myxococcales bacterium]